MIQLLQLCSKSKLELNSKKSNSSDAKKIRLYLCLSFLYLKLSGILKFEFCQIKLG